MALVVSPSGGRAANTQPLGPANSGSPGAGVAVARADHVHPDDGELLPPGGYVRGISGSTTQALALETEIVVGMLLAPQRIDKIAVAFTVAGSAGSVIRVGLRADSGDVTPGPPVREQPLDCTGTPRWIETTSMAYDHPGGPVWASFTAQGWGLGTAPIFRAGSGPASSGQFRGPLIRDWANAIRYAQLNTPTGQNPIDKFPTGEDPPNWGGASTSVPGALPNVYVSESHARIPDFWIKRA